MRYHWRYALFFKAIVYCVFINSCGWNTLYIGGFIILILAFILVTQEIRMSSAIRFYMFIFVFLNAAYATRINGVIHKWHNSSIFFKYMLACRKQIEMKTIRNSDQLPKIPERNFVILSEVGVIYCQYDSTELQVFWLHVLNWN